MTSLETNTNVALPPLGVVLQLFQDLDVFQGQSIGVIYYQYRHLPMLIMEPGCSCIEKVTNLAKKRGWHSISFMHILNSLASLTLSCIKNLIGYPSDRL